MNLKDNTILITGGTSGIGRALAEKLHSLGNQVIIAGRKQSAIDDMSRSNQGLRGYAVDLQNREATLRFTDAVAKDFPRLNTLINNAGIMKAEELSSNPIDLSISDMTIKSNILSALHVTGGLLPALRNQPRATIITTTSALAYVPLSRFPTYCASKAFLHSWLESLRFQLRNSSVEVLELIPTYVQTEIQGTQQATDPRAMPLAEFIDKVIQLLSLPTPSGNQLIVPPADGLRWAERSGTYDKMFAEVNSH